MKKIYHIFFLKNLMTFLIPMLVPLLILGTLSSLLIQQNVKEQINQNNLNFLKQTKDNVELIFTELDSLHLQIVASAIQFVHLKNMLQKPLPDVNDFVELATLKNFIDSPAIARPYINSIYIYIDNDRERFITSSTGGLVSLDDYPDTSWYDSFRKHSSQEDIWSEKRTVPKAGSGDKQPIDVISMYRTLSVSAERDGVIALNVDPSYIEKRLAQLTTLENQSLLVIDKNNEVLFKNKSPQYLQHLDIAGIISNPNSLFSTELNHDSYVVTKLKSEKYGWSFVSIVPNSSLYQVPNRLRNVTIFLLILSFLGGMILAYHFTRKNLRDIQTIIKILEHAEHGRSLPPLPSKVTDVYSHIVNRILKNFIEQNYLKIQMSERKFKAQAMEFTALQSQLNPHFLFNTLETINWKAISITHKPSMLNTMVENLADILKYSLDGHHRMVILQMEIKYTKSYIDIQKVRYADQFQLIWEYNEEVHKYHVMKLILQPLIENSLYHGIREKGTPGLIKIKIRIIQSHLTLSIIDNGLGMKPEKLSELRANLDKNYEKSKHIGLYNTHKRLKLTYGEQYGVVVRSKFGWGTAVHISIPIH